MTNAIVNIFDNITIGIEFADWKKIMFHGVVTGSVIVGTICLVIA